MNRFATVALFGFGMMASAAAHAGDRTVTLAVSGMDCAACPVIVKSSLEAVPGVLKVVVSLPEKTAIVTFDDSKTTPPALINATGKAGYPSMLKG